MIVLGSKNCGRCSTRDAKSKYLLIAETGGRAARIVLGEKHKN